MIAIGCLVQWYEIDMYEEYLDSLVKSIGSNKDKVIIDMCLVKNQELEQINEEVDMLTYIIYNFIKKCNEISKDKFLIKYRLEDKLYTIADYRRDFNSQYCNAVDILVWGESDMLVPSQAIESILLLHNSVKDTTPKWLGFFATCKMWDDSWKILEHPKLTNLERDPYAWYGTRSYMSYDKMEEINSDVESPEVTSTSNYKFNGCGLIISSELVRRGVNIPESVFFTHEDTGLLNLVKALYPNGQIPQYIFKNILLVHNRENPNKRKYIKAEKGVDINEQRKSNQWYKLASEYSKVNAYNLFNQSKIYNWNDVWKAL